MIASAVPPSSLGINSHHHHPGEGLKSRLECRKPCENSVQRSERVVCAGLKLFTGVLSSSGMIRGVLKTCPECKVGKMQAKSIFAMPNWQISANMIYNPRNVYTDQHLNR